MEIIYLGYILAIILGLVGIHVIKTGIHDVRNCKTEVLKSSGKFNILWGTFSVTFAVLLIIIALIK